MPTKVTAKRQPEELSQDDIVKMGVDKSFLADMDDRDLELENIIGNLMIAQYQTDKLRSRLGERVGGYGSASNKKTSAFVYKHNDHWYKITTRVDEYNPTKAMEQQQK